VLIAGFPAGAFAANCYVVAPAAGEECLIIDPGQDAEAGIEEILATHRLKPAAVLLTHGHLDHVWSVAPVCGAKDIPAYIHPADRELLSDPAKGLPLGAGQQLFGGLEFTEPDDVRELSDGITLDLVGLSIVVDHAPGHTRGSVAFRLPGERQAQPGPEPRQSEAPAQPGPEAQAQPGPEAQAQPGPGAPAPARGPGGRLPPDRGVTGGSPPGGNTVPGGNTEILFSGDLLFAGSIGRTDLPGGDYPTIMRSLARVCLNLPDETIVLSGHGPQTTIGAERRGNPFLNGMQPIARGL
jgi:hydroxyacylglutathione hydrolase